MHPKMWQDVKELTFPVTVSGKNYHYLTIYHPSLKFVNKCLIDSL